MKIKHCVDNYRKRSENLVTTQALRWYNIKTKKQGSCQNFGAFLPTNNYVEEGSLYTG
jgi:hypothetical protein